MKTPRTMGPRRLPFRLLAEGLLARLFLEHAVFHLGNDDDVATLVVAGAELDVGVGNHVVEFDLEKRYTNWGSSMNNNSFLYLGSKLAFLRSAFVKASSIQRQCDCYQDRLRLN